MRNLNEYKEVELFLEKLIEHELWIFDVEQNSPLEEIFQSFSTRHIGYAVYAEERKMYKIRIKSLYKIWVVEEIE